MTPAEARAKLLRSLIEQPKSATKESDREKLTESQVNVIRELANEP